MVRRTVVLLAVVVLAGACGESRKDTEADRLTPPKAGACRDLSARDLDRPTSTSPVVP